jgi:hypothetical protein
LAADRDSEHRNISALRATALWSVALLVGVGDPRKVFQHSCIVCALFAASGGWQWFDLPHPPSRF